MPRTFFVFDFGTSEDAAQQARHRLEAWRQAFRLGDKLTFKFERQAAEPASEPAPEPAAPAKSSKSVKSSRSAAKAPKKKSTKKKKEEPAAEPPAPKATDRLRVFVRLEFSDHEKLSYQRWLDRIPAEPPFLSAEKQIVRRGQEDFEKVSDLFDELI